jgi:DNA repair exonuclease SbcCD ATPase subunit
MKIVHFADIHFSNNIEVLKKQESFLPSIYEKLNNIKPDRIVLAGDTFDKELPVNECKLVVAEFLNKLTELTDFIIINKGNHEQNQNNLTRLSSIESLIRTINNKKILYLNKTGEFNDPLNNQIKWINWNWGENINPYNELNLEYDKYFYIDVFHNPIGSTISFTGQKFDDPKYVSYNDFKGNLCLAGDIHQYQLFKRNKEVFGAYPSSLFQKNFGESIDKHGFIIWDIDLENKKILNNELIEVLTDYAYHNIIIPIGYNYDSEIIIDEKYLRKTNNIKFKWQDYTSTKNNINISKLKKSLKNFINLYNGLYEIGNITIDTKEQKNEKSFNQVIENKTVNLSDDKEVKQLYKDYIVNSLKYDESYYEEVIKIDDIINLRIENILKENNTLNNIEWKVQKIKIDNFKSYSEVTEIDLNTLDGLYQIKGDNKVGKSKIYDAFCYVLYGKTLDTLQREALNDNKFLNYNSNNDYCIVSAELDINNKKFLIERRTDRKWNKLKTEITTCSTKVDYFEIDEDGNIIVNNNDSNKNKTKKLIEEVLGTFDDFLRFSFITKENLNSLLTVNRANFLDSLLKDMGLDLFELKLNEYKDYKKEKELKEGKIVLDLNEAELTITNSENEIIIVKQNINELNDKINELSNRIIKGTKHREELFTKLHKIEEEILSTSLDKIDLELHNLLASKQNLINESNLLQEDIDKLPDTYDEETYNKLIEEKNQYLEWSYQKKNTIKSIENNINTIDNNHNMLNGDIVNYNKEIKNNNDKIVSENNRIDLAIENEKKQITLNESSKYCITCKQLKTSDAILAVEEVIKQHQVKITKLLNEKDNNIVITKLLERNDEIVNLISSCEDKKVLLKKEIEELRDNILVIKKEIEDKSIYISDVVGIKITEIELIKKDVEKKEKLASKKELYPIKIENITLKIETNKLFREKYLLNLSNIEENEKTNHIINKTEDKLNELNIEKTQYEKELSKNENIILVSLNNKIITTKDLIEKYKIQLRKDEINKLYITCISRDGIPSLILKRSLNLINEKLLELLHEVPFTVYFNEDIQLMMYQDNNPDISYKCIEGSGFERTMISIALRIALRDINCKNKNNLLLMDELFGSISEDNIPIFLNIINEAKKQIEKIFLIEHSGSDNINPDCIIEVKKDSENNSVITFKY